MASLGMSGVVTPVYQPIVDLQSGEALYFEALARATTQKNHVKLLQFAEFYGFIHLLDLAMIDLTAQALQAHPRLRFGVNVSVATIEQFTGQLVSAFYNHLSLAPRFVIEITETVPIRDTEKVRTFVRAMKAAGAMIAFDDFGDGFFTYNNIGEFRPHILKIAEKLFTQRHTHAREIEQILEVANEHGMQVVAEAIDSEEKRRDCLALGIRYAQGFLVGAVSPHPEVMSATNVVRYQRVRAGGNRVMVLLDNVVAAR